MGVVGRGGGHELTSTACGWDPSCALEPRVGHRRHGQTEGGYTFLSGGVIARIGQGKGAGKRTGACRAPQPHLAVQLPALGKRRAPIIKDTVAAVCLMTESGLHQARMSWIFSKTATFQYSAVASVMSYVQQLPS